MSTVRIHTLLKKLTALLDDHSLNPIERDLAKKYLVEIYELLDEPKEAVQPKTFNAPLPSEKLHPQQRFNMMQEIEEVASKPSYQVPSPRAKVSIESVETEVNRSLTKVEHGKEEKVAEVVDSSVTGKVETDQTLGDHSIPEKSELEQIIIQPDLVPAKYLTLFQKETKGELSEKLSRSPISDLQKAFGINDKLLIVNELFDGQQVVFQETVDVLNSKYSFEDAKSYLTRCVIDKYGWLDEEKVEPARNFIKLVERRFIER